MAKRFQSLLLVAVLALVGRGEWPWFHASFESYTSGQPLSDLGAVGGSWTIDTASSATNVVTAGMNAIAFETDLSDTSGVAFTAETTAGTNVWSVEVRVCPDVTSAFGSEPPEGIMAFTFVEHSGGTTEVDFAGVVSGRWQRLSAPGVTFALETWYDVRMETRDFGGQRYGTFFVKADGEFVQLANPSGAKWFPLDPADSRPAQTVAFLGAGAFSDFSGLQATSEAQPVTMEWTGGAAGNWDEGANWSLARVPTAGDLVRLPGTVTVTSGVETATLDGALVWLGANGAWDLLAGGIYVTNVTVDVKRPRVGQALAVEAPTFHGLKPALEAAWYRSSSPRSKTYSLVSTDLSYTPRTSDFERWFKCVVSGTQGRLVEKEFLFSKLPVLYLSTDDGRTPSASKEEHTGWLFAQGNEEWKSPYNDAMIIKVRGNSTRNYDKKPWKLKLAEKTKLYGIPKSKHWVLLANYNDESAMRNKLSADLANEIGSLGMESTWVECVLNGSWQGLYLLSEHVRIDKNRVDIFDWEDEAEARGQLKTDYSWVDSAVDDITGGYLFESSEEYDGLTKFTLSSGNLVLKTMLDSPEYLKTNPTMVNWCKDYLQKFCAASTAMDGYASGLHYSQYADIDSMVAYLLAMELVGNNDAVYKSRFFYKDRGDLLKFGPVWDFDWGVGNDVVSSFSPTGWKVVREHEASFFREWADDPWFCTRLHTLYWGGARDVLARMIAPGGEMDLYKAYLLEAGTANDAKWWRKRGFAADVERLRDYLVQRLAWLDAQFADVPTLLASFRNSGSTRPYDAAPAVLPIAFANLPPGRAWKGEDLHLAFTVGGTGVATVGVFVNGLKLGEPRPLAAGRLEVVIPATSLTAAKGTPNCVSLLAYGANGTVTARNYVLVTYVSKGLVLIFK